MPDVPEKKLTTGMRNTAALAVDLAYGLMQVELSVRFIRDRRLKASAGYGDNCLVFNLAKLPADFFDHGPDEPVLSLLIHEFGHQYESNHLSAKYYRALSDLGARLAFLVQAIPDLLGTTSD